MRSSRSARLRPLASKRVELGSFAQLLVAGIAWSSTCHGYDWGVLAVNRAGLGPHLPCILAGLSVMAFLSHSLILPE